MCVSAAPPYGSKVLSGQEHAVHPTSRGSPALGKILLVTKDRADPASMAHVPGGLQGPGWWPMSP